MKVTRAFPSRRRSPASLIFLSLVLVYLLILARPDFPFANVVSSGNLRVYTHGPVDGLLPNLQRAESLLATAPLQTAIPVHRLYLTRSYPEFTIFAPGASSSFGVTYPWLDSSFLTTSDISHNTIHRNGPHFATRPLSAVIAHETTHTILEKHFGYLRMLTAPSWKAEGYCDYVAGGHSIGNDADGLRLLTTSPPNQPSLAYFRGYIRIKYLLERKHLTLDQVFLQSFDTAQLDPEAIASLTNSLTKSNY